MATFTSIARGLGAAIALVAAVAQMSAPAFGQAGSDGADNFSAGVALGRTLNNSRKCVGSGDFYEGCVGGVQERQFDQQADQALDSDFPDAKPSAHAPAPSPSPGPAPTPGEPPNK